MQGFGDNSSLVLPPFDNGDEEMHVLFIETGDNRSGLARFWREELGISREEDEEI